MRRSQVPSLKKKNLAGVSQQNETTGRQSYDRSFVRSSGPLANQQSSEKGNFQVFSVVFGTYKPGKKHKEWTDDAILMLNSKSIKVFNLEGECIDHGNYTKDRPLKKDETVLIGSKEYMMIDPISREDYESKRCFQQACRPTQTVSPSSDQHSSTLKRKFPNYISPFEVNQNDTITNPEESFEVPNKLVKRSNSFNRSKINETTDESFQAFQILYGTHKPGKKHREWENDAILVRKGLTMTMYSLEGDKMQSDFYKKTKQLKSGDILLTCGKEVQICDPVSREDFETERCFQEGFCPETGESEPIEHQQIKSSFKSVLTNETANAITELKAKKVQQLVEEKEEDAFETEILFLPPMPNEFAIAAEPDEISVDFELCKFLRPHQREGIEFMYKCITGFHPDIRSCILGDEQGLGKTLQCIALIYTLLKKGPFKSPYFYNRVLILAPSSLVQNWRKEFEKWLKNKRFYTFAVDGKKNTVKSYLKQSRSNYPVLIVSYDMFQRNHSVLANVSFDLVVCDEGHRLKNSKSKVFDTIRNMECKRRILLTGTPVQNNLKELFSLCDLVNPGILGTQEEFYNNFEEPINAARKQREENASIDTSDETLGNMSKVEEGVHHKLFRIISSFFIRRLQSSFDYLPKRVDNIVICNLSDIQRRIYEALLNDKHLKQIMGEQCGSSIVKSYLPYILFLRKLCNHPFLINADIIKQSYELNESSLINELAPVITEIFRVCKRGVMEKSGKFDVLVKLLKSIKEIDEKVVVVSHFTQTLDLIHQYCRVKNYKTSRLDGSTPVAQRQKLVDEFNSDYSSTFVFLLSSKAGGLGLNLIGASHIILYDLDWNPSHDEQAMARIFRDGQKKTANIYRLLTVGTIEEKIFQRQLDKQNLSTAVGTRSNEVQLTKRELKDIFTLITESHSTTHDALNCNCQASQSESLTQVDQQIDEATTHESFAPADDQVDEEATGHFRIKQEKNVSTSDIEYDSESNYSNNSGKVKSENEEVDEQFNDGSNTSSDDGEKTNLEEADEEFSFASDNEEEIDLCVIKPNDLVDDKPVYEEELSNESNELELSNESNELELSNDQESVTKVSFARIKPLLEWKHFSYPFDQSDMSSVLVEMKDSISFVFRTESQ